MGRGRAKAKQTKVARELKYSSPTMDIDALQRECGSGTVVHETVEEAEPDHPAPAARSVAADEGASRRGRAARRAAVRPLRPSIAKGRA